jgi:two-component system sensor histidine kinase RegB
MNDSPLVLFAPTPEALRRLVGLRYAVALLLALALVAMRLALDVPFELAPTAASLAALLAVYGQLHVQLMRGRPVSERQLFVNLVAEVLALTALLYFTGGPTNPLVSLYLLPLTVAANLLTRRHTWALALAAFACYSLLLVTSEPLDPHAAHGGGVTPFGIHVVGMWITFVVSAALIAHYVSRMAASLRERERLLARAREESLRNERIVALGTLGASAAHDLGTPLAIISVLAEDMAHRHRDDAELAIDVAELQTQVAHCKRILGALGDATGAARGEAGALQTVEAFVREAVERWHAMRPASPIELHWAQALPGSSLIADRTLEQALHNLLNNAADASPSGFEIAASIDDGQVVIDLLDRGAGLTPEVQARAGELFFTTKAPEGGKGIGLFLANATIERFGGSVRLFNRPGGGACTRITLPTLAGQAT